MIRVLLKLFLVPLSAAALAACGGDSNPAGPNDRGNEPAPVFTAVTAADGDLPKGLRLEWTLEGDADHFTVEVNQGGTGFVPADVNLDGVVDAKDRIAGTARSVEVLIALHLSELDGMLYQMVAYDAAGDEIARSDDIGVLDVAVASLIGYVKASNTDAEDVFGLNVALSADGRTLAVGADGEDSAATGVNGDDADNAALFAGAVYVFTRNDAGAWTQQAYIKASNTDAGDGFGWSIALSADGRTLGVGAGGEDSAATGVNGDEADNTVTNAGAVYVFTRDDAGTWAQQAYIKASNTGDSDAFGGSVALSIDGSTLAVSARTEDSAATGVNGDATDDTARAAGAVYVFTRDESGTWTQQAYIKASNTNELDLFGSALALSADGHTLAVAALAEASAATGINGDESDNTASYAGAVYVFARDDANAWAPQAYVKASNTDAQDRFGYSVALSSDGATLAVGARYEDSAATGVNGDEADGNAPSAGAAYVFTRDESGAWTQQDYIKASNTDGLDVFGTSVALSAGGDILAVAALEASAATGVNGDEADDTAPYAGAVYMFTRDGVGTWAQQAYVKASNTDVEDTFGASIAVSADGATLVVGADFEDGTATGINGDATDNSASNAGAVYIY